MAGTVKMSMSVSQSSAAHDYVYQTKIEIYVQPQYVIGDINNVTLSNKHTVQDVLGGHRCQLWDNSVLNIVFFFCFFG